MACHEAPAPLIRVVLLEFATPVLREDRAVGRTTELLYMKT